MVLNSLQAGLVGKRAGHLVLWFVLTYCSFVWDCWFFGSGTLYSLKSRQTMLFLKDVYDFLVKSEWIIGFFFAFGLLGTFLRCNRLVCQR